MPFKDNREQRECDSRPCFHCCEDILQICLEAVRNACIHSQSPTVTVDLYVERAFMSDIKDEGIGFDSLTKLFKRLPTLD